MINALFIAWKDTQLRLRDPLGLVFSLAGPLVIVMIIGLVFGQNRLEPAAVELVDLDGGQLGAIYSQALTSTQVQAYLNTTFTADASIARAAVDRGQAAAAVIVPAGLTQAVFSGGSAQVEVYTDPAHTIGSEVVRAIVNAINLDITRNSAEVQTSLVLLVKTGRITPSQQASTAAKLGAQLQTQGATTSLTLNNEDVAASAGSPTLAYYAPAMLVFFLMLNAVRSGPHLLEEKDNKTLDRLLVTPLRRSTIIAGKLMGDVLLTGAQAAILVLGLGVLFHVNLGDPLNVFLLLTTYILCTTALGLALGGIARTNEAASGATQGIALLFGLLGGAFIQTDGIPVLSTLQVIAPNHWALDGLLKSTYGGVSAILPQLGILVAFTLVFAAVGARFVYQKLGEV